jgi:ARTD15 N-terminal domain/Poly(ADP-ribose) polymerase catalytic domain
MDEDIARAAREKYVEVEFLISALASAAFSSRFATLLQPVPAPEVFLDRLTGECNIHAVRAALAALPSSPSALSRIDVVQSLPQQTRCLVHFVLFGPSGSSLGIRNVSAQHPAATECPHTRFVLDPGSNSPFQRSARSARNKRTFALDCSARESFQAFHGAPGAAWYSILHHGLLESANDPANISTGRAFGEGLYLAERFHICLLFAPPCRVMLPSGWPYMLSAVGVFRVVANDLVRRASTDQELPAHYVVADEASVVMEEILIMKAPRAPARLDGSWLSVLVIYGLCLVLIGSGAMGALNLFRR